MRTPEPTVRRRLLRRGALVVAITTVALIYGTAIFLLDGWVGYDYALGTRPAAEHVFAGESPYPSPSEIASSDEHTTYLYPPPLAFVAVPTLALSPDTAERLVALIGVLLILGTLLVLRVRDPWCYIAILFWAPAANGVQNANVTLMLMLVLALAWRWRDRTVQAGLALAAAVGLKLFLTPLLLWPIARRRFGVAATAVVSTAIMVGGTWAAIGFADLSDYPELLSRASERWSEASNSVISVADALGLPGGVGRLVALVAGLTLAGMALRRARRGEDFGPFVFLLAAALVMSPIVWQHYLLLLAVPLAIARPTISVEWLLPLVLWFAPTLGDQGPLLVMTVAVALVVSVLVRRPRSQSLALPMRLPTGPSRALAETVE